MTGIEHGADLVAALAESGTGAGKLAVGRAELARVYAAEHREATAAEVLAALEASGEVGEGTVAKARSLAAAAQLPAAPAPAEPIEVTLRKRRQPAGGGLILPPVLGDGGQADPLAPAPPAGDPPVQRPGGDPAKGDAGRADPPAKPDPKKKQ